MVARRVIALLAIGFFALPLALRAGGVTARPFENRALAAKPSLDAGWDVFDQTTRFFVDHMPLREQAVRAYSWTAQHVFEDSTSWRRELVAKEPPAAALPQDNGAVAVPAPGDTRVGSSRVLRGDDGWLYLGEDLGRACSLKVSWAVAVQRLEAIARELRRSGRTVAIVLAANKSSIYPEHFDTEALGRQWDCAVRGESALWSLLGHSREPALVPLRDDLRRAKQTSPDALFHRKDSHWNEVGASVALPAILARLGRGVTLRPGELVPRPPRTYTGDLTVLLGTPEKDTTPDRAIRRSPGAPVLGGMTLMLQDSFGDAIRPLIAPYVQTLDTGLWVDLGPDQMWERIKSADRVVIEVVERELNPLLIDGGRFTLLLDKLRRNPLPRRG